MRGPFVVCGRGGSPEPRTRQDHEDSSAVPSPRWSGASGDRGRRYNLARHGLVAFNYWPFAHSQYIMSIVYGVPSACGAVTGYPLLITRRSSATHMLRARPEQTCSDGAEAVVMRAGHEHPAEHAHADGAAAARRHHLVERLHWLRADPVEQRHAVDAGHGAKRRRGFLARALALHILGGCTASGIPGYPRCCEHQCTRPSSQI